MQFQIFHTFFAHINIDPKVLNQRPLRNTTRLALLFACLGFWSCVNENHSNTQDNRANARKSAESTGVMLLEVRKVITQPDCWNLNGEQERILVPPGTQLEVAVKDRQSRKDILGNPYTLVRVVGPANVLQKFPVSKFQWGSSNDTPIPQKTFREGCWMEIKYFDNAKIMDFLENEALKVNNEGGKIVLNEGQNASYLKERPIDSQGLLPASPETRESGKGNSSAENRGLASLPTSIHAPEAACLITRGLEISFLGFARDNSGKVAKENGHVRLIFSPEAAPERNFTLPKSTVMGAYLSNGQNYEYFSHPLVKKHWEILEQWYPNHPDWNRTNREGKRIDPTSLPNCYLNKSSGWVFVAHYRWPSHLQEMLELR